MPSTFWNLSNHPIETTWGEEQRSAARAWGGSDLPLKLRDLGFPDVNPDWGSEQVAELARKTLERLEAEGAKPGEPVHVMGEFTLVYALVQGLKARGLSPVAATTLRDSKEERLPDGSVTVHKWIRFRRFREY